MVTKLAGAWRRRRSRRRRSRRRPISLARLTGAIPLDCVCEVHLVGDKIACCPARAAFLAQLGRRGPRVYLCGEHAVEPFGVEVGRCSA